MMAATNIRLPGVYFLPPPSTGGGGLPPLDVAAFVGFAERGPLDTPVAITDVNTYRAIFGGETALAREPGGQTVYGALPISVANFFGNGGRRCFVVRVAGKKASSTRFRLPGLVALTASQSATSAPAPKLVALAASSVGRWSERLRLGTRLRAMPLSTSAFALTSDGQLSWLTGSAPDALRAGDVLRLTFNDGGQWLFPINSIEATTPAAQPRYLKLVARRTWRLDGQPAVSPEPIVNEAHRLTFTGTEAVRGTFSLSTFNGAIELTCADLDQNEGINPGDVLQLILSDGSHLLFAVGQTRAEFVGSPRGTSVTASAMSMTRLIAEPLPNLGSPAFRRVERLRFDLLLRDGKQMRPTMADLSFNPGSARFWGETVLLESNPLYRPSAADPADEHAAQSARLFHLLQTNDRIDEGREGSLGTTELAGLLAPAGELDLCYLPLDMLTIPGEEDLVGPDVADVGNDDLDVFDPSLFVDSFLVPTLSVQPAAGEALMKEAFDRFYVQNKKLRGMHSLMFVEEVALISVPDATQRNWDPVQTQIPSPPVTSSSITSPPMIPDNSVFMECDQPVPADSNVVKLPTASEPRLPVLNVLDDYNVDMLLEIQHAMLNFCQARRDLVCILTLPLHFEKRHCVDWQEKLRQRLGLPARDSVFDEGAREISDLSYAAVFHPWLLLPDAGSTDGLRRSPCDGAVCGIIAARERARQVWVAPANVPLPRVLGLTPNITDDDWADLFAMRFNLVREEPRDFRLMSAHTLSDEAILLQVSVRRLMILLRKLVVDRGMDFVFENNDERFREAVSRMLVEILKFLFDRGAFAGATPDQSFRVTTDASINTPQSVDAGRFIAQIQVAPSQPMEFITVLLTRVGEDLLQAHEA
jgi:hypothetical protein